MNSRASIAHVQHHWENQQVIVVSDIRKGHFIARLDCDWNQSPFPIQGFLVNSKVELDWLRSHCKTVVIDTEKSKTQQKPLQQSLSSKPLLKGRPIRRSAEVNELVQPEVKKALTQYVDLERAFTDVLAQVQHQEAIDIHQLRACIEDTNSALQQSGPALIWLTKIKAKDHYTFQHCINVGILAVGLANQLGWKTPQVVEAGLAGMLHDIGKTFIPTHILNKTGPLSNSEFEIMKTHAYQGYQAMIDDESVSEAVKLTALQHHERPDGSGYPNRLRSHEIAKLSKLISVVDAYDAITSNRCYQKARNHHLALSILWKNRGSQFDADIVEALIAWLGWVSPGNIVELSTGDLAIVVSASLGQRLQPTLRLVHNDNGAITLSGAFNLADFNTEDRIRVSIKRLLTPEEANIDFRELTKGLYF